MVNGVKVAEAVVLLVIAIAGFVLYVYDANYYLNPLLAGGQYLRSNPIRVELLYNTSENIFANSTLESGWIQLLVVTSTYNSTHDLISLSVQNYGGNSNVVQTLYFSTGSFLALKSNLPFIANNSLLMNSTKMILYNGSNEVPVGFENLTYTITQNGTKYFVSYGQYYDLSSGILVYRTFSLTANNSLVANGSMILQKVDYISNQNRLINPVLYDSILILLSIVVAISLFGAVILLSS